MPYHLARGSLEGLSDLRAFVRRLDTPDEHPDAAARSLFDPSAPIHVARAPGRLDVMGGIADYSGALVLQLPLQRATCAAVQRTPERTLVVVSLSAPGGRPTRRFELPLAALEPGGEASEYEAARALFARDPAHHWAAYALGAFLVLRRERGVHFPEGARILVTSDVPEAKGVSSSAALEAAVMRAVCAAFDVEAAPYEQALLCQRVEQRVAGAPCGVMDQMTAFCGETDRLMALLCQPARLQEPVPIPPDVVLWGIDSGVRHAVSGADYGSVRTGAFMGYRIVADLAGLEVTPEGAGRVRVRDRRWGGYLANIRPARFEQHYEPYVPERMRGRTFLERYDGITDEVTSVDPDQSYAVRLPTAHPVYEQHRIRRFASLLGDAVDERTLHLLGALMYGSHASYSACGLGSDATDRLVDLVRAAGPERGLYGARITGGGSGGTVAVLARSGADEAIQAVADAYARATGYRPILLAGSSPGAGAVEPVLLMPA